MDQRGHQPVDEHQLVAGAGTRSPLLGPAPRSKAGPGRTMRRKTALKAFDISFDGRLTAARQ
ncbi:hypothetical protein RKD42_000390 [Streptomyces ambofaciens]